MSQITQTIFVAEANAAAASEAAVTAMWTDPTTGLVWQREDDGFTRNQDDSISYCRTLSLGGHSDWRLPSRDELLSLWKDIGSQNAVRRTYFANMKSEGYWSSKVNWAGGAWPVNFSDGSDWHYDKMGGFYARCVRSGQ
jgi:hypothetical protein